MTAAIDSFFARARMKRSRVERDLEAITAIIASALGKNLAALLLVGGYARGEGGRQGDGPDAAPFNDYDLVAVLRSSDPEGRALTAIAASDATRKVGLEVDLWPITVAELRVAPPTLFWLDVALGSVRVLLGDPSVLDGVARITVRDVPLEEAARLLANRATGLALSRLEDDATRDPMRAARHVYKAIIACGDARLLAAGAYSAKVVDRAAALERLADRGLVNADLAGAYRAAAMFRARPDRFPIPADMKRWFDEHCRCIGVWHMGFESFRLGTQLTPLAFAWRRASIYPRKVDGFQIGLPAALRAFMKKQAALFPYVGHPRERLARASVSLAYLDPRRAQTNGARWLGKASDASASTLRDALLQLRDVGS